MYTGRRPWVWLNGGRNCDANPDICLFPAECPEVYQQLCRSCTAKTPGDRPSFSEIVDQLQCMLTAWMEGYDSLVSPSANAKASLPEEGPEPEITSVLALPEATPVPAQAPAPAAVQ